MFNNTNAYLPPLQQQALTAAAAASFPLSIAQQQQQHHHQQHQQQQQFQLQRLLYASNSANSAQKRTREDAFTNVLASTYPYGFIDIPSAATISDPHSNSTNHSSLSLAQIDANKRTRNESPATSATNNNNSLSNNNNNTTNSSSTASSTSATIENSPPLSFSSSEIATVSMQPLATRFVLFLPHRAQWFRLDTIDAIERRSLPDFFVKKPNQSILSTNQVLPQFSIHSPPSPPPISGHLPPVTVKTREIYKTIRDFLVLTYHSQPHIHLSATVARRSIAMDPISVLRIHCFLDYWGIINARAELNSPSTRGADEELRFTLETDSDSVYEWSDDSDDEVELIDEREANEEEIPTQNGR